jgi:peptidoglycan/LPS O-acetylase OafA/YrhL
VNIATCSARLRGALGRETSSGRYIPEIDGLRCLAIGSVVLFHLAWMVLPADVDRRAALAGEPLTWVLLHGFIGVQLFFVISGFVLALPFAEARRPGGRAVGLGAYYLRRLTRLEPPYVICLLLLFGLRAVRDPAAVGDPLPHLLASLFYVHNIAYDAPSTINSVAWSLEVEVQFYLLVPLLTRVFAIAAPAARRGLLVGAMLAAPALQSLWPAAPYGVSHSLLFQIQYFLAGFVLADCWLGGWQAAARGGGSWDALAAAALLAIVPAMNAGLAGQLALPPLMLAAAAGVFRGRRWNRLLTRPWITVVGGMCYTIYLYHLNILGNALKLTGPLTAAAPLPLQVVVQALATLPLLLLAAAALFALFEKPFMRRGWPSRLRQRLGRGAVEAVAG